HHQRTARCCRFNRTRRTGTDLLRKSSPAMFAEAVQKCSTGRGGSNNGITCRAQDFAAGAWTIGWHDQEKNQSAPSGLETSGIIPIGNGSIQDLQQRGPRGSRLIGQPSLARASSLG